MKEQLTFIRINSPDSAEEYSEFTVNTKDLYSLLRTLNRCEEPADLATRKRELDEDSQLTKAQIQDLLDGALMWIALDHPAEIMPYKAHEIMLLTQRLIAMGASAQTLIKGGTTLLMIHVKYPERLEMLLNMPAGKRPDLNRVNRDGDTALILAVYNHYLSSAYQLIQAGADPAVRSYFGKKAAMYSTDCAMIDKLETKERELELHQEAKPVNQDEFQGAFFRPAERQRCNIM